MTDDTKKSRTIYQREWRYKNPDKVRKNRNTSYWNNPEKHRKKARETWHKNKESTEKGKANDIVARMVQLSPTTAFRLSYISKHARKLFEEQSIKQTIKTYPLYNLVRQQMDSFHFALVEFCENKGGLENIAEKDIAKIAAKFEYLTYPFNQKIESSTTR